MDYKETKNEKSGENNLEGNKLEEVSDKEKYCEEGIHNSKTLKKDKQKIVYYHRRKVKSIFIKDWIQRVTSYAC